MGRSSASISRRHQSLLELLPRFLYRRRQSIVPPLPVDCGSLASIERPLFDLSLGSSRPTCGLLPLLLRRAHEDASHGSFVAHRSLFRSLVRLSWRHITCLDHQRQRAQNASSVDQVLAFAPKPCSRKNVERSSVSSKQPLRPLARLLLVPVDSRALSSARPLQEQLPSLRRRTSSHSMPFSYIT